ncbi:MAG: hypothetical protein OEZ19_00135 [Paracoccaceae bacterium]|nr:hypothetical protein [Paracoccaceae bacterium]
MEYLLTFTFCIMANGQPDCATTGPIDGGYATEAECNTAAMIMNEKLAILASTAGHKASMSMWACDLPGEPA